MKDDRARTRAFVVGSAAWCALSLAPIVALSPALATTFLVLALALATSVTLLVSLRAGIVAATVSAGLFALALAELQVAARSILDPGALANVLAGGAGLQAILGVLALGGAVAFAEMVSLSLQEVPGQGDQNATQRDPEARPEPRRVRVGRRGVRH